ncbi:PFGI-1 class ICE element type IV pilus protein PilL2 [Pseudomonas protegens]|uniref:PFGI-1 class ICE element type IV pilus protein PilL2 n=1 Tax=Pseudomonas protegens TaxID=380021 RepID=UPI0035C08277
MHSTRPLATQPTLSVLSVLFALSILFALLTACTTPSAESAKPALDGSCPPNQFTPALYPEGIAPEKEPVVRYGRYTLVSTLPSAGQRDLMAQIIDVTIPPSMIPNLRDTMHYVMNRSGYTLCPADNGHVDILYSRPLPAAQYKLGPMTLRNTLQILAGPAWQVLVDEVNRQVCFVLRPDYQLPEGTQPHALPTPPPATPTASTTSATLVTSSTHKATPPPKMPTSVTKPTPAAGSDPAATQVGTTK